ncbi:MAG: hypothetical protein OXF02_08170 [Simkaniaceae bacterium]|nr:hypothetical protein [Simkaniaceae bacterium]
MTCCGGLWRDEAVTPEVKRGRGRVAIGGGMRSGRGGLSPPPRGCGRSRYTRRTAPEAHPSAKMPKREMSSCRFLVSQSCRRFGRANREPELPVRFRMITAEQSSKKELSGILPAR